MKKLTRIRLNDDMHVLSPAEQKMIMGLGQGRSSSCSSSSSYDTCNGSCTDDYGHSGYCGWVAVYSKCMCATVYIG